MYRGSTKQTRDYVARFVVPDDERMSMAEIEQQDRADARTVLAKLDEYKKRIVPVVKHLKEFTGQSFFIEFERNHQRGIAKPGGIVALDYALLNKSEGEIALTLAHEWGHHTLGHVRNKYSPIPIQIDRTQAEHDADYFGGIFLGYFGYSLENLLPRKMCMPEGQDMHGTRFERACIIADGYERGQKMRAQGLSRWPGYQAFVAQETPFDIQAIVNARMDQSADNNPRKLSK